MFQRRERATQRQTQSCSKRGFCNLHRGKEEVFVSSPVIPMQPFLHCGHLQQREFGLLSSKNSQATCDFFFWRLNLYVSLLKDSTSDYYKHLFRSLLLPYYPLLTSYDAFPACQPSSCASVAEGIP